MNTRTHSEVIGVCGGNCSLMAKRTVQFQIRIWNCNTIFKFPLAIFFGQHSAKYDLSTTFLKLF